LVYTEKYGANLILFDIIILVHEVRIEFHKNIFKNTDGTRLKLKNVVVLYI